MSTKQLTLLVLGLLAIAVLTSSVLFIVPGLNEALERKRSTPPTFDPVPTAPASEIQTTTFSLDSPAFGYGAKIPAKHTCDGENISPPLNIKNVPSPAKSLAIIVEDPDAPGGPYTHWTLWNIPTTTTLIEEGKVPAGVVEGVKYSGPCPGSGEHRYLFKLYALTITVDLPAGASRAELDKAILGKNFAAAEFLAVYSR